MGTQYFDGRENAHTDYPIADLLQMIGRTSRPLLDNSGKCAILCHSSRKEYYKKFLQEAIPVESHFHHFIHDYLNTEVVVKGIEHKQLLVDLFTCSFMHRRLDKNPNFYNLQGVAHEHLSDHLSELVENALDDLVASKFVAIEDDFYRAFQFILTPKTKMKGLLDILASASEYAHLPLQPGEEHIHKLIHHHRFSSENPTCTDPNVKANALLHAHFSRHTVAGIAADQREVLLSAHRLLEAMIDVCSKGWLNLALTAMNISQTVTRSMWEYDSLLLLLPHYTKELAKKCEEYPGKRIETISELMETKDDERRELLQMSDSQLLDIAQFCRRYPNIEMTCDVLDSDVGMARETVTLLVALERDLKGCAEVGPVNAPRLSKAKEEGWWLLIGDSSYSQLLTIKRVTAAEKENEARI